MYERHERPTGEQVRGLCRRSALGLVDSQRIGPVEFATVGQEI